MENANLAQRVVTLSRDVRSKTVRLFNAERLKTEAQEVNNVMEQKMAVLERKCVEDGREFQKKHTYRVKKLNKLDKELDVKRKTRFKLR